MVYSEFCKIVFDCGWMFKFDVKCKVNVVGGDYKIWCLVYFGDVMCEVCDEVFELSVCSGDGYCLMQFMYMDVVKDLVVSIYGEINNWNVLVDKLGLMVMGWEYDVLQVY